MCVQLQGGLEEDKHQRQQYLDKEFRIFPMIIEDRQSTSLKKVFVFENDLIKYFLFNHQEVTMLSLDSTHFVHRIILCPSQILQYDIHI